jgi:DNA-directed RNA polymerase specialized sigma24 family protein
VLARYQELHYDEIAELLNVDVGTVKVRVHRAMKQLREIFNNLSSEKNKCTTKTSETSCPTI